MKKILFLFGTRPEAIKMSPLIKTFKNETNFDVRVAVTAQHREMLDQVVNFFDIELDYDLNVMKPNQKLHHLTSILIDKITEEILEKN
jgi:UDP-N-acetylglucosamine 2-epimerase (non-hydrolysing)